jgi:hypothetical protein
MQIELDLTPRRVRRFLHACIGMLVLAHAALAVLKFGFGHDYLYGAARLFDLDAEQSVPTLYSAAQLFACAGALAFLAAAAGGGRDRRCWAGLAAAFAFLGLDEAASIHELFSAPTFAAAGGGLPGGYAYCAWVAPYAAFALGVGAAYLRFLARLPRATAVRFVAGGAAFVGAAVGIEVVEAAVRLATDADPVSMAVATSAQEIGEMLSIAYFLTALVRHVEAAGVGLAVRVSAPAPAAAAPAGAARAAAGRRDAPLRYPAPGALGGRGLPAAWARTRARRNAAAGGAAWLREG